MAARELSLVQGSLRDAEWKEKSNMPEAAVSSARGTADCARSASEHSRCCFEQGSDKLGALYSQAL